MKLILCHLMRFYSVLTLIFGSFNACAGVTDEELGVLYIHASDSITYVLVSKNNINQYEASNFCKTTFAGQLALFDSEEELNSFGRNFTQALADDPEIHFDRWGHAWINQKTNVDQFSRVNISAGELTDNGSNCVSLSNWEDTGQFRLYGQEACDSDQRQFLCQSTPQAIYHRIRDQTEFMYEGKLYKPVLNQLSSPREANRICQEKYNGSLASVTTQHWLDGIHSKMQETLSGEAFVAHNELWVCGKVDATHDSVIELDPPPSFQRGSNCVIMRESEAYRLQARDCHHAEYGFLCETNCMFRCPEGVTSHEREVWFDVEGTRYIAVLDVRGNHNNSLSVCRDRHGATLVNITTLDKLEMISNQLTIALTRQYRHLVDEFWVGGKTAVRTHSEIDTTNIDLTTGENCVLLSNYRRRDTPSFSLYSKTCNDFTRRVICEVKVESLLVHDHSDSSQYLFVMDNPLNSTEAQRFCHIQYGGDLIDQNDVINLYDAAPTLLRGQITTDLKMFWMKQNILQTVYGDWEVHEKSDCPGNDWGRQAISTAEECLQHCYSRNGCVGVVFGYSSIRGYECYPKRICHGNITPLENYDTYTRVYGDSCKVMSVNKEEIDTAQYLDITTVPCAHPLDFVCALKPGASFDYYYINRACSVANWVSNVRFQFSENECSIVGGVWAGDNCVLRLCGSNQREVEGWIFASPGECTSDTASYTMILTKVECRKLKGSFVDTVEQIVNCTMKLCNTTDEQHLSYVISTRANCPADNVVSDIKIETHPTACKTLTSNPLLEAPSLELVDYTLENAWQDCNMVLCQVKTDCKLSALGKEYTGTVSLSVSGLECKHWDAVDVAITGKDFPDSTLTEAANYCRNPTGYAEGPYCYVDGPQQFEICNIPFCEGSGEQVETLQLRYRQYLLVPGYHGDPWGYCARAYDAHGALLNFVFKFFKTSDFKFVRQIWMFFAQLRKTGKLSVDNKILVPARVQSSHPVGQIDETLWNTILDWTGDSGWCVHIHIRSNFTYELHAADCASTAVTNILCERHRAGYYHYQVDGGVPQKGIYDVEQCAQLCTGECRAAGFHRLEQSCWHYYSPEDSKPGRASWSFIYVQKAASECHRQMSHEEGYSLPLNTSSRLQVSSAISSHSMSMYLNWNTLEGYTHGAWIANATDEHPWAQMTLPGLYKVYGITTKGLLAGNGLNDSWVTSYSLSYSKDCNTFTDYDKTLIGNKSPNDEVTNILDQTFYARCVKIHPLKHKNRVALRLDLLGCTANAENLALGKLAKQSGTFDGNDASRAVDGFLHALEQWDSCSVTMPQVAAYFVVDLVLIYEIERVHLQNKRQFGVGNLGDFSIKVGYNYKPSIDDSKYEVCAQITGDLESGELLKVDCEPVVVGRFVMIKSDQTTSVSLTICEIEVYSSKEPLKDVARGKPCDQSSRLNPNYYAPQLAVDGQFDNLNGGRLEGGSCAHTENEDRPWWRVDLKDKYSIQGIAITPRSDCCEDRLSDLHIYIGEERDVEDSYRLCTTLPDGFERGETRIVHCDSKLEGRIVKIFMDRHNYLTLCEVQVYGKKADIFTYGGNGGRGKCVFPFVYKNNTYEECTVDGRDRGWCAVTNNYPQDGLWAYCMDVRLSDGRHAAEGRVEMLVHGSWESVCDDGWSDATTDIVCQQLGYKGGATAYPPMFSPGKAIVLVNDLSCYGNETALSTCSYAIERNNYCTKLESASVICEAYDGVKYYGQPAFERSQLDEHGNATILIQDPIQVPGFVQSWHFYSKLEHKHVFLQVWRKLFDFKHVRFMLVGESRITPNRTGYHKIIAPQHSIRVQPGDLIGLSFSHHNPVPYDYTFHCKNHVNTLFSKRAEATVGSIHTFSMKDDDRLACRLYSLYAKVQVETIAHTHEFNYANYQYRVFLQKFSAPSADLVCKNHLGNNALLVNLTSSSAASVVQRALEAMEASGSFWIKNLLHSDDAVVEQGNWAPCQPESGKLCIVISNDNDEKQFLWYTKQCNEHHYIICQLEIAKNEADNRTFVTDVPTSDTTKITKTYSHKNIVLPIVLPILLILLVAGIIAAIVLVNRYLRKRQGSVDYGVQSVQYRSTGTEDEEFLHMDTASTADSESTLDALTLDDKCPQNISNPLYNGN